MLSSVPVAAQKVHHTARIVNTKTSFGFCDEALAQDALRLLESYSAVSLEGVFTRGRHTPGDTKSLLDPHLKHVLQLLIHGQLWPQRATRVGVAVSLVVHHMMGCARGSTVILYGTVATGAPPPGQALPL